MVFGRPQTRRLSRRQVSKSEPPRPLDATVVLVHSGAVLLVTTVVPVVVGGIPHIGLSGGAHTGTEYPTAVTVLTDKTFTLTYAAAVAAADVPHMVSREPMVRTQGGGYLVPNNAAIA